MVYDTSAYVLSRTTCHVYRIESNHKKLQCFLILSLPFLRFIVCMRSKAPLLFHLVLLRGK